ncbi:hypothetical protein TIFTF001_005445 [Ficus carica]|uniref:Uncharacterized protein n=1 Tax=Ficus carica TaxID=3494 RepID=A0AA87ZLR0_FICCA|nr:hypothetical protein TIFTF001_005445 [Ficus carica]
MARDLTGHREYDKISTLILPCNELHELTSLMKEIDDRCQMNGGTEPWTSYDECVYDHGIPYVFASAGLQPNQLNLVEDTKSVLTSCSDSNCSINQPDLGYETESNIITSSYNSN